MKMADLKQKILTDLRSRPNGRMYPKGMSTPLRRFLESMQEEGLVVLDTVNCIDRVRLVKR